MNETSGTTFYKVGFGLLAAIALFFALFVNGALPGLMVPTTGQAIWMLGFAQSFANGLSIYATNFGLPSPAPISFGLAAALPTALFLKIGIPPADAYSLTFAIWFGVAFYGAYRFVRHIGGRSGISLLCALLWLTAPVIWVHADYSMVSLGIALLPAYFYTALQLVYYERKLPSFILFIAAALSAVFMDGYSFMMFACATAVLLTVAFALRSVKRMELLYKTFPMVAVGFAVSYFLYKSYVGKAIFEKDDLDLFRAFGANIEFFFLPTRGILWLSDLFGFSAIREEKSYFGDASVLCASFALVSIVAGAYALATKSSDARLKATFLLVAVFGFYMALGPSFKLNILKPNGVGTLMPLQYAPWRTGTEWLSYLPGFSNMRASYRWVALGMFGAWALLALHVASRRVQSGATIAIILAGIAFNIPAPGVMTANTDSEQAIDEIDRYIENLKPIFQPGEKVAFLPFRNDFFVNYMASKLNISTYNVGGDKNLTIAMENWPDTMLAFEAGKTGPDFAKRILWLLTQKDADVAAIPYIDLLWAAHQWPYPPQYFDEMQPYIDEIRSSGMVDISGTENFTFVRLKPEFRRLSSEELSELSAKHFCKEGISLFLSSPAKFSDTGAVCGNGWVGAEDWGRWTIGKHATLHYHLPADSGRSVLEFDAQGFVGGNLADQKIEISINGKKSDEWEFTIEAPRRIERLELPQGVGILDLYFSIPNAKSPKDAGVSSDLRPLGLGLIAMCLTKADEPCLQP
ncbi:hypothetical protein [Mesorhizobium sp. M2C.T.Ca.TU.002.02.1.1]|uniref:hypothetical protein n=1 Tax=Mesorhizobium sp. M2C.T.Ca.TU.002.02.1.1 TaxID=2496788 RepID=UPI000FCAA945|nr:hypothetical protein [Mesorhizobium sp. M2C.T.Ca.TU.002.02.1.1]RUU61278.1 hypothetical protein EOD07_01475 [Mesorhizobium sp. M2C.T.Ca.TU.002.02.1.1]